MMEIDVGDDVFGAAKVRGPALEVCSTMGGMLTAGSLAAAATPRVL